MACPSHDAEQNVPTIMLKWQIVYDDALEKCTFFSSCVLTIHLQKCTTMKALTKCRIIAHAYHSGFIVNDLIVGSRLTELEHASRLSHTYFAQEQHPTRLMPT